MDTLIIENRRKSPTSDSDKAVFLNHAKRMDARQIVERSADGIPLRAASTIHEHAILDGLQDELQLPSAICMHGLLWDGPLVDLADKLPKALAGTHPRRQRDYLLGRHCAESALVRAGYKGVAWLSAGEDKLPIWPAGWLGSISHAGRGAVAAVSRCESCELLGIDMERLIDASLVDDISHLVAGGDEIDLVLRFGMERGLTLLFSAKEALYKALFPKVRCFFDFTAAQVAALDDCLLLRLTVPWGAWPSGTLIPVRFAFRGEHVFTAVYA